MKVIELFFFSIIFLQSVFYKIISISN